MIRANLYQSCQPDGLTGLMAERSGYSARDREPGSLPRTSSRKRPFPVRDRRPRCCPRFDRGSAWCEPYARVPVQGNGTQVPKSPGRWSGASWHHGWDARTRCLGAPGGRRRYPSGVTHRLHRRGAALSAVVLTALVVSTLGGCATTSTASFDPTGPCTTDGRLAGAYRELEARVPTSYEGRRPDQLDSGRHCTRGEPRVVGRSRLHRGAFRRWDMGFWRQPGRGARRFPGDRPDRRPGRRLLRHQRSRGGPNTHHRRVDPVSRGPRRPSPRHDDRQSDTDRRRMAVGRCRDRERRHHERLAGPEDRRGRRGVRRALNRVTRC